MRVGLVGAGSIAQSWLEAIRRSTRTELVGVVDTFESSAAAAAEPFGAQVHTELTPLLESGIDLLVISTPPSTHPGLTVEALNMDVSVLCEKPLAVHVEAAARMVDAAAQSKGLLTMASKFRFVDAVMRARSMVTSGLLGEVVWLRNTFSAPVDMRRRWNADPALSGGGVLIDNGTHSVDLCRYLVGPVVAVQAIEGARSEGLAVEDTVQLQLRTEPGTVATVNLSWTLESTRDSYVELDGTEGHVCVGWQSSRFMTKGGSGWAEFSHPYDKVEAFTRNLDDVLDAVEDSSEPLVGAADALASVQVIEAAYTSLDTGRWVTL